MRTSRESDEAVRASAAVRPLVVELPLAALATTLGPLRGPRTDRATPLAALPLRVAARDRTVLLMTHRLRAARAADRIVVLGDGRVVESGHHDELLAAGGFYAELWRIQQIEEEITRA